MIPTIPHDKPMKEAQGLLRWALKKRGFAGITLPPFGIYLLAEAMGSQRLIRHEQCHWEQYERMGLFKFYWSYFIGWFKYGYRDNPMEVEARQSETLM